MMRIASARLQSCSARASAAPQPTAADDVVKLTIRQRGFWDTAVASSAPGRHLQEIRHRCSAWSTHPAAARRCSR